MRLYLLHLALEVYISSQSYVFVMRLPTGRQLRPLLRQGWRLVSPGWLGIFGETKQGAEVEGKREVLLRIKSSRRRYSALRRPAPGLQWPWYMAAIAPLVVVRYAKKLIDGGRQELVTYPDMLRRGTSEGLNCSVAVNGRTAHEAGCWSPMLHLGVDARDRAATVGRDHIT